MAFLASIAEQPGTARQEATGKEFPLQGAVKFTFVQLVSSIIICPTMVAGTDGAWRCMEVRRAKHDSTRSERGLSTPLFLPTY